MVNERDYIVEKLWERKKIFTNKCVLINEGRYTHTHTGAYKRYKYWIQ